MTIYTTVRKKEEPVHRVNPSAWRGISLITAVVLGVSACGDETSPADRAASAAPGDGLVQLWGRPPASAPGRLLDAVDELGMSASTSSRSVKTKQLLAIRQDVEAVIASGGRYRLLAYADDGERAAMLVDQRLSAPGDGDDVDRGHSVSQLRAGVTAIAEQVLGLAPISDPVADAIRHVHPNRGSDIAAAIGHALELDRLPGATLRITNLDDGLHHAGGITLPAMIGEPTHELGRRLAELVGADGSGADIRFVGMGVNAGDVTGGSRSRTLRLRAIWKDVCRRIRAASCEASS